MSFNGFRNIVLGVAVALMLSTATAVQAQMGACCFRDGTCMDLTELECKDAEGEFRGDGTNCAGVSCVGACCTNSGGCFDGQSKEDCDVISSQNGSFQGFGSTCAGASCPSLNGACCLLGGFCIETDLNSCLINLGFFQGVGTECTGPMAVNCTGACCKSDGTCVDNISYQDCCSMEDGIFQGIGTTCGPDSCPGIGACCLPSGICEERFPDDCFGMGGCYQGNDTTCATVECNTISNPAAAGACIDELGNCSIMTECDCLRQNDYVFNDYHLFLGPGTDCANLPDVILQPGGGQVNISGATLFSNFAQILGANNDFINVDGDLNLRTGFPLSVPAQQSDYGDCSFPATFESNARTYLCPPNPPVWWDQWIVQYRSVGSLNGVNEFIDYQLLGTIPFAPLTERGVLNGRLFSEDNTLVDLGTICPTQCLPDIALRGDLNDDGAVDGLDIQDFIGEMLLSPFAAAPVNGDFDLDGVVTEFDLPVFIECILGEIPGCGLFESGTPVCPQTVDLGSTDVPMAWVVRLPGGTPTWDLPPLVAGYGNNPIGSSGTDFSQKLVSLERDLPLGGTTSLNVDTANPDDKTVFDNIIAYSPVVIISNHGTGKQNVQFTELQHHFVTGRWPTGENLVAAVRDSGSGTRNACMNSLGIDPSWGRGDNIGVKTTSSTQTILGPLFIPSNAGGSSRMEGVVQNARLALGYTGLFGSSRAAADASSGRYEILNVRKDVPDRDGDQLPATQFVRPSLNSVLDNGDANTGWQIGGLQTLASRGDRTVDSGPTAMSNPAARDYLNNLLGSIADFSNAPFVLGGATPAAALSEFFVVNSAVDATPKNEDPLDYTGANGTPNDADDNPVFSQPAQDAVRSTNTTFVPEYGVARNPNGRVPTRLGLTGGAMYSDGSVGGTIGYRDANGADPCGADLSFTISSSTDVFTRMAIQGDFNVDGERNVDDIDKLVEAFDDPCAFQVADAAVNPGNYIVPEILGDFDGDGNFTVVDIRYFGDGLALDGGTLDREMGFTRIDQAWSNLGNGNNFFGTTLATGAAYGPGDSRGDVAGNTPSPGALPTGADGVVGAADIDYVCRNFVSDWTDLDLAFDKDLSCDMDGDLDVDINDVNEIVVDILGTTINDLNLDGVVNQTDKNILCGNFPTAMDASWSQGDVDCDGDVDQDDLDQLAAAAGLSASCP